MPDISIHDTVKKGNIEAVQQHLAAGTDVNAKDFAGMTPLHQAAGQGRKDIAELLIANGADVNVTTNRGATPLNWAVFKEIADLLRQTRRQNA